MDEGEVLSLFKPGGRLSAFLPGYEPRPVQQEMVSSVIRSLDSGKIALIEAGTGTGKSIAYLIPAVLKAIETNSTVLIATHTINLQEQLFEKDIPLVRRVLGIDFKAAILKGMGNYLCRRKLGESEHEIPFLSSSEQQQMREIESWAQRTKHGVKGELHFNPYSSVWEKVNCEQDTCTYRKCPFYKECHFFTEREKAHGAQILIVNHHLLADLSFRQHLEGVDEPALLPNYSHVVIDEAHHIEDVATAFFGSDVSRTDILKTMGKLASEKVGEDAGKISQMKKKLGHFYDKIPDIQMKSLLSLINTELPLKRREVLTELATTFDCLALFFNEISGGKEENTIRFRKEHKTHPLWEEEVIPESSKLVRSLKGYTSLLNTFVSQAREVELQPFQEQLYTLLKETQAFAKRLEGSCEDLERFVLSDLSGDEVRWLESRQVGSLQNIHLIEAKLEVAPYLVETLFSPFETTILCSATLSTNGSFQYVKERLGLNDPQLSECKKEEKIFPSPFDYQKQSFLAVSATLPDPTHLSYVQKAADEIVDIIQTCRGGVFVLFTSYSMLKECYAIVEARLKSLKYNLFKQGDDQRQTLLHNFKKNPRSVLFATDSFWEGVDVTGEALKMVIIVKLPFRVPSEPIFQARSEKISSKGGDPFRDYALPQAIMKFKQGFGRLIRHKEDYGTVVVLDKRIMTKGYGKKFLASLPKTSCLYVPDLLSELKRFYAQKARIAK